MHELTFRYDSATQRLEVRYVRVRKADGTLADTGAHSESDAVNEITAPTVRDAPAYANYKEVRVALPELRPGETLEYEIITRTTTPLAPGEFWYDHDFLDNTIVLDERLEISIPQGRAAALESPNFHYDKTAENGRVIYRWKRANLRIAAGEDTAQQKAQSVESKRPDVRLTTFVNWEGVAHWYAKIARRFATPTPDVRAKTLQLIAGRASDPEKIQALYEYVSKNIRYVVLPFDGPRLPHSAAEIFKNQYGDSEDQHILLASMLEASGIPSAAVLISSSRQLDVSMPSPSQFDHVITAVPSGGGFIWMDTTAEVAPFRLLAPALRDKFALVVPDSGPSRIVRTPADPPFPSTQRVEIDASISDLGKLTGSVRYSLRGDSELLLRAAFHRSLPAQWKKLAQTILTRNGLRGEVVYVKPSDPTASDNPFKLEIGFTQPGFLDWSSKTAKVGLPLLAIGTPSPSSHKNTSTEVGSPLKVTTRLRLTLPANFTVLAPTGIAMSRDYADFKSSYRLEDHTLIATRSLDLKTRKIPSSQTDDYAAFARAVQSDEAQQLVVENPRAGAPAIPPDAKLDDLIEAGVAALNSGNPASAISLFRRALELDPKHAQAWSDLGLAYLKGNRAGDAADAFRKQVEITPKDEYAYDYLGVALERQHKHDEAVGAFRNAMDLNPLDPLACAALGAILLEQEHYADAISALEKAAILSPDNAPIRASLGEAYLGAGDKQQGAAALEKAAELSRTPVMWNDVAYKLANAGMDMEKARQYAEAAVSAVSADLQKTDLSHLTMGDLNQVVNVAAYWDTLGWIYFQKGDFLKAESYIRASWLLDQRGEVANHLAQIYEKLGRKDQAIRTFALATASPHPAPEARASLARLAGPIAADPKIDALIAESRTDLNGMRLVAAGNLLNEDAHADFFIFFTSDDKNGKPNQVQFIGGSNALRRFAETLRALNYSAYIPSGYPVKIIRRGTLACSPGHACIFTLIPPEDVHAIN